MKKSRPKSMWELLMQHSEALVAFEGESDRAVALITAAFIDDALEELLRKCFVETQKEKEVDDLFSNNGPFGSFSSRINTCYALGHISRTTHKDLNYIRAVRNDFAHSRNDISFSAQIIKDRIKNLSFPIIVTGWSVPDWDNPRVKYIESTSWNLNKIQARLREIERPVWPENKA